MSVNYSAKYNEGFIVAIVPNLRYYFMDLKKAREFLWEYYTECSQWEKDNKEVREYNRYTLSTIGDISGIGHIYEKYFEDFKY